MKERLSGNSQPERTEHIFEALGDHKKDPLGHQRYRQRLFWGNLSVRLILIALGGALIAQPQIAAGLYDEYKAISGAVILFVGTRGLIGQLRDLKRN